MGLDASQSNPIREPFLIYIWADYQMGHAVSYSQNFKFPSSDSWPSQNLGLDASWTNSIRGHCLISFWADYRMGHTGGYSQNFKFPSADSESPQNLGLDASWMKQIGEGHSTLSWCPNTILDIAHATGWIRHPYVDIQNLLENLMEMSTLTNQAIYGVMWPSDLKLHQKILSNDTHLSNLPNQAIYGVMWPSDMKLHQKCCLMILISSHLSNLPNQAIYGVMWPSDLKSHQKMLSNDTHLSNLESCDHQIWNHIKKRCLMMPISPTPTHPLLLLYPYSVIF